MPNSIFFPKWEPKIASLLQTAKVKTVKYKKLIFNAQISKDKVRGRVVANKSMNKMLI